MTDHEPEEPAMPDVAERTEHDAPEVLGRADLSPAQWIELIASNLGQSVGGIVTAGRNMAAAKASLDHGAFEPMLRLGLKMELSTAERYMAIAAHPVLANPATWQHLPPAWTVLYKLSHVEPAALAAAIDDGRVWREMAGSDALALRRPDTDIEITGGDAPFPSDSPHEAWRRGKADCVVELADAKLLARQDHITRTRLVTVATGVTRDELVTAIQRFQGMASAEERETALWKRKRLARGAPHDALEGEKWCIRGQHFVVCDAVHFGVNVRRPDGLSDWCRECWRSYWAEREGKPDETEERED